LTVANETKNEEKRSIRITIEIAAEILDFGINQVTLADVGARTSS
jgi:hypothetical protein